MAVRFAVSTGNWSNTAIWDNGLLPVAGDTIYPNGFGVTIDQDINISSLNNNVSNVYLPNMAIPAMTGNTQPSGIVNSNDNVTNAYLAFDQDAGTFWAITANTLPFLSYQYTSTKIIKKYYWAADSTSRMPSAWTFQGSNDGTTWTTIETVTGNITQTYLSGATVSANTTAYIYYRMNITALAQPASGARILRFEMTESTLTSYGITTGGAFLVSATLSGTRNIVFSGPGIITNNIYTAGIVATSHVSGNTVNFNVTGSGYIINPQFLTASANSIKGVAINGNGAVNFNGNIWGQTNTFYNDTASGSIYINANATVTINGNVYAPVGQVASASYTIQSAASTSSSAILNINGDIIGSGTTSVSQAILLNSTTSVNITGNIISNKGNCIQSIYNNIINITGTVTVTDTLSVNAIYMTSVGSLITMNGSITNKGNLITIWAPKIRFASTATPYWIFQTNGASDITLAYGAALGPYPVESDVRTGVQYATSPIRTGTCAVPLPQYVSQGVPTGSTVGNAYMDPESFLNAISTSSNVIATRLKNVSTVQTTGGQMAAFSV